MAVFAAAWAVLGVSGLSSHLPTPALLLVAAATVAVAAGALGLTVRYGKAAGPRRTRQVAADSLRRFRQVTIGQSLAIGAVVVVLGPVTGQGFHIPAAVCVVVGLHFLPLASAFGQSQYRWTAGALTALGLTGVLVLAGGSDPAAVQALVGLGAAVVLWATALDVARRG